jgi:hypothetical protein
MSDDRTSSRPAHVRVTEGRPPRFDPETDAFLRQRWEQETAAFLDSPMFPDVPAAPVLWLLPTDELIAWTEQIEQWGAVTIVTPDPEWDYEADELQPYDPEAEAGLVALMLRSNAHTNPSGKVGEHVLTDPPVGMGYTAADLVDEAKHGRDFIYWATDTDVPATFTLNLLWPLGSTDAAEEDNNRVGSDLTLDDVKKFATGN